MHSPYNVEILRESRAGSTLCGHSPYNVEILRESRAGSTLCGHSPYNVDLIRESPQISTFCGLDHARTRFLIARRSPARRRGPQ
jgi:hypothetical protein